MVVYSGLIHANVWCIFDGIKMVSRHIQSNNKLIRAAIRLNVTYIFNVHFSMSVYKINIVCRREVHYWSKYLYSEVSQWNKLISHLSNAPQCYVLLYTFKICVPNRKSSKSYTSFCQLNFAYTRDHCLMYTDNFILFCMNNET